MKDGRALLVGKPGWNISSGRADFVAQSNQRAELTIFDFGCFAEGCTDNGMDGYTPCTLIFIPV